MNNHENHAEFIKSPPLNVVVPKTPTVEHLAFALCKLGETDAAVCTVAHTSEPVASCIRPHPDDF